MTGYVPVARSGHTVPSRYAFGNTETFWAWDLRVMPPAFKRVEATAVATGISSYVFIDNALLQIPLLMPEALALFRRLELEGSPASLHPELAIIPLTERVFAPLPTVMNPDPRVTILLTDLGNFQGHGFDGFFNAFDQMSEAEAWSKYEQHSNERNILYVHVGPDFSATQAATIVAHELHHLVAHHARGPGGGEPPQETWLSETAAEAAMLFNGFYADQAAINRFVQRSASVPLVNHSYVDYGITMLFAAFLIDRTGGYGSFDRLIRMPETGRAAVEKAFEIASGLPSTFDAIYSEFISYVFRASNTEELLPNSWSHNGGLGLKVPPIARAGVVKSFPYVAEGEIYPYSFAIYELSQGLPANVTVKLEIVSSDGSHANAGPPTCNDQLELMWKPLPGAIAIYGVGCRYGDKRDLMKYRLSIHTISR